MPDQKWTISLKVDESGQAAVLVFEPGEGPFDARAAWAMARAAAAGQHVAVTPQCEAAMGAIIDAIARTPEVKRSGTVASAKPASHGRDGWYEPESGLESRAAVAGSHYERSAFVIVEAGRRLGRLHPPTRGEAGEDVRGQVIVARSGNPAAFIPGDNVQVDGDGVVSATRGGAVRWNGPMLRVVGVLEIPGNVDFSTGNVDFPGDVVVGEGVRDRFSVTAGGSLDVHGLVEAASVRVGENCRLRTGMAGREKGVLDVGGALEANYLDQVRVRVGGDLRLGREMTSCRAEIRGDLDAEDGVIAGGEIVVGGNVVVGRLGMSSASRTEVTLWRHPWAEGVLSRVLVAAVELTERASGQGGGESGEKVARARSQLGPLVDRAERVLEAVERGSGRVARVKQGMGAGTRLVAGSWVGEVTRELEGEFEIRLDAEGRPRVRWASGRVAEDLGAYARMQATDRFVDRDELRRVLGRARQVLGERTPARGARG